MAFETLKQTLGQQVLRKEAQESPLGQAQIKAVNLANMRSEEMFPLQVQMLQKQIDTILNPKDAMKLKIAEETIKAELRAQVEKLAIGERGAQQRLTQKEAIEGKTAAELELLGPQTEAAMKIKATPTTNLSISSKAGGGAADPTFAETPEGFKLTLAAQTQAEKFSSDYQTVRNNIVNIETAVDRMLSNPDEINRIATDQAIITSFNKILDPTSVVRESEYARTPANEAVIRRAKGWLEKLKKGGAGITQESIIEIRDTAREMAELRREIINTKLETQLRQPATGVGLDPDVVAPLFPSVESLLGEGKQDLQTVPETPEELPDIEYHQSIKDYNKKLFED